MSKSLYESALKYHTYPRPGKLAIVATKPLANQRDLSLAYSPGVAYACEEIVENPAAAGDLTARSNLVAVVTNGTAVLGLGDIGPLASKPVMEGKAVLFKKFSGIDVFDIEINEPDPKKLVDIIASLEPTFGAINLEDIKAPECFEVERELSKRLNIPVFHDDQHGTAIITAAAVLNGLELVGKNIGDVKLVTSGAGAAAIACLDILVHLGMKKENIFATDVKGVIYEGRGQMDECKARYAQKTSARTLNDIIEDADVFLGLSVGGILKPDMVKKMAKNPLILALANPNPEINPEEAKTIRPDAIVATGRSDYPNQVNNVLCFPFIFRGALDVGATTINTEMKLACVKAIANLAKAELSDVVASAYGTEHIKFGPEYLIPKPFDPRLMEEVAPAVAKAAIETGVATRTIDDYAAYRQSLSQYVFRSGLAMKPLFLGARADKQRIAYADGEDERVLRAVQIAVDEGIADPIIIGRRTVVQSLLTRLGLRLEIDKDFELVDPQKDPRFPAYWQHYHELMERRGVSPDFAKTIVRTNTSVIASLMVLRGEADAMLCGPIGRYKHHLECISNLIGYRDDNEIIASVSALVADKGVFFVCDGYVNENPNADEIASMTLLAAEKVKQFGFEPKVALVSHSNFGSRETASSRKMQDALQKIIKMDPNLEVDGEMHADTALNPTIRRHLFPNSRLEGKANLLVMPTLDAANISINMVKTLADAQPIGPILLGLKESVHILTPSTTVRGVLNMTAVAAIDAQGRKAAKKNEQLKVVTAT